MKTTRELPWADMKVAFDIDDCIQVWNAQNLPKGWNLVEVDGQGARFLAIFRVEGMPLKRDAYAVLKALYDCKAILPCPTCYDSHKIPQCAQCGRGMNI